MMIPSRLHSSKSFFSFLFFTMHKSCSHCLREIEKVAISIYPIILRQPLHTRDGVMQIHHQHQQDIAETPFSIHWTFTIIPNTSFLSFYFFILVLMDSWGIRPHLWHKKWNTLSGGEMQRISLAIGCSFRPEILLLDGTHSHTHTQYFLTPTHLPLHLSSLLHHKCIYMPSSNASTLLILTLF